jgi:hypothetical protein
VIVEIDIQPSVENVAADYAGFTKKMIPVITGGQLRIPLESCPEGYIKILGSQLVGLGGAFYGPSADAESQGHQGRAPG